MMTFRERLRKMLAGQSPAECPLPDCSTCGASALPLDLAYTAAWCIEQYPDAWYFEDGETLQRFAEGILALKLNVDSGRLTP